MADLVASELVAAVERLALQSRGDVAELVAQARQLAADPLLARAAELAAESRAHASDRTAGWSLACLVATLRASEVSSAQEEAELTLARVFGERAHCALALAPLPRPARWMVAGAGEPPLTPGSIELARKNAGTYLERLDAELSARRSLFADRLTVPAARVHLEPAIREVIGTYGVAASNTRASLSRIVDHVCARGGDGELARQGRVALAELDEVMLPSFQAQVDQVFALMR